MGRQHLFISTCCALAVLSAVPRATPQQATFRSRISVVPVDVRVVDPDGKPVTGLKAGDFIVIEDGVRQEPKHFSEYTLAAGGAAARHAPRLARRSRR